MSQRFLTLALACLFSGTASAHAPVASIGHADGTVLVSQGEQFVTATEGQALRAGDRVMVMEGGSAQLSFKDGCALPLAAGSMLDVPEVSPCAGGVASVHRLGPMWALADAGTTEQAPAKSNANTWLIVGGAVAAIALVAGGGSGSDDRPERPASP